MSDERRPETADELLAPGPAPLADADRARFAALVLPHLDAAYGLARHLLRDPDEAADATQDAVLRAARAFGSFRGGEARAWVLAIVRNTCLSQLRKRRTRGETVPFDEAIGDLEGDAGGAIDGAASAAPAGPEAAFVRTVAAATLQRALDELPVAFREVIVLRELEDLSYKEIAHVTGAPIGTVMSRLARGRRMLAESLTSAERRTP